MTNKQIWEEHDVVFHYTTQAGLEGILSSQELHATHFTRVNDSTEMNHIESYLVAAIKPSVQRAIFQLSNQSRGVHEQIHRDGSIELAAEREAQSVVSILYKVTFGRGRERNFFEPYTISFCTHRDEYESSNGLLSQWRGYGKESGYAIVFKTKGLVDMMQDDARKHFHSPGFMGDVVYEGSHDAFKSEFSSFISALERLYPDLLLRNRPDFKALHAEFIGSVGRFKHRGFKEEQEVRMVLSPFKESDVANFRTEQPEDFQKNIHKKVKDIRFRRDLAPYIAVPACETLLPIVRIIVGPNKDKEKRREALVQYIQLRGWQIPVTVSDTPLI